MDFKLRYNYPIVANFGRCRDSKDAYVPSENYGGLTI